MRKAVQNMWSIMKQLVAVQDDLKKDIKQGQDLKVIVTEARPPVFVVRMLKSIAIAIPAATAGSVLALVILTGTEVWKTLVLLVLAFVFPVAAFIYLIMAIGESKVKPA